MFREVRDLVYWELEGEQFRILRRLIGVNIILGAMKVRQFTTNFERLHVRRRGLFLGIKPVDGSPATEVVFRDEYNANFIQ